MDTRLFESLEFRSIGPHRGGRVTCIAGHPEDRATFIMGSCAGGVFKTDDAGAHWYNISDGFFKTAAIGALAIAESDPNVIYVGTGESTVRSNVSHGDGVYKSTDGGNTWTNVGLTDSRHIGDIAVHPHNPDLVYVAALGHAWGPSEERGVFRSKDGGATWENVLHKSSRAGAVDLSMDPHNPRVIFAVIWQTQRYPHALDSGGEECGIWRTTDGGDTWEDITRKTGLPTGMLGKVGVAVSPAKSGRVWAQIEAEDKGAEDKGGVYRSDDGGATWQQVNSDPNLGRRPWYYMHIYADPSDADTVWIMNLQCWKSIDGGKTFTGIPTPHGDNHGFWIDPKDSNRLGQTNDGGANLSYNGGLSWSSILNQPTAQFYHVTVDNQVPYHVYGSQQDNWAMRLPSISFEGAISWKDYVEPGGGESGHIAVKPTPPFTVFGGGIGTGLGHGRLRAWNPETRQSRNITVWPETHGFGSGTIAHRYRFQWTFPIEVSPHDPDTLYVCSNHVHVSKDEGGSWEVISPDLTRNDSDKQQSSGGKVTADNSGAEIYCTIFAFKESPHEQGVFWTGSDDGLLHLSRDGGKTWQNITPPGDLLGEWARISIIEASPHDPATAYVAANRYQHDDNRPYLFKTNDYGKTWQTITNGIPEDDFTRTIREDPNKRGVLYAGTETGIYVSVDDGANWTRLQVNLPVCPIHDLVIKDTDMVVATHGRAFWILDDVTPLHQLAAGMETQNTLFKPRATTRFRINRGLGWGNPEAVSYRMTGPVTVDYRVKKKANGQTYDEYLNAGKNPPNGVIIHFFLAEKPEGDVTLTLKDSAGAALRSFSTGSDDEDAKLTVEAGANRLVWDMTIEGPTKLEEEAPADRLMRMFGGTPAPKVVPGEYQVTLEAGDWSQTQTFSIAEDPRLPITNDDLTHQFELKKDICDKLSVVNMSINTVRRVRAQVEEWEKRADNDEITKAADALKEKLTSIEGELMATDTGMLSPGPTKLREKLTNLAFMIDESDHAPTVQAGEVYGNLAEDLTSQQYRLQETLDKDLAEFTNKLQQAGVPLIATAAPRVRAKQTA